MTAQDVGENRPIAVRVVKGRTYLACVCGKTAEPPFCDGSHGGTGLVPAKYIATADRTVLFCGCRRTGSFPLCDGSHAKR